MQVCDKCSEAPAVLEFMDCAMLCEDCYLFIKYMLKLQKCNPHLKLRW